jgi:signal transduction histidine kinase
VAHRLGTQLVSSASIDELLDGLTSDIGESMRLESVTVVGDDLPAVRWGEASSPGAEVELRHRGELVGLLQVSALPGEQLSARDLATLRELASVVAAALVIGRGAADLEDLRSRLAAVRLEERRVLRREIHDGLGPSLAGISLGLQGARNLLRTDPEAGLDLLAHLQGEVEAATSSVRSLSHHLLPPILDELGLVPALAELAGRFRGPALAVTVECDRLDDLDPQVAAAAYGIASEALTNVHRHARASHCRIVARRHPAGSLLLVVTDDGAGRGGGAAPGVGMHSMRERADEQGGRLDVRDREGGGTEVVATLPLVVHHD